MAASASITLRAPSWVSLVTAITSGLPAHFDPESFWLLLFIVVNSGPHRRGNAFLLQGGLERITRRAKSICLAGRKLNHNACYYAKSQPLIRSVQHPTRVLEDGVQIVCQICGARVVRIPENIENLWRELFDGVGYSLPGLALKRSLGEARFEFESGKPFFLCDFICPGSAQIGFSRLPLCCSYLVVFFF